MISIGSSAWASFIAFKVTPVPFNPEYDITPSSNGWFQPVWAIRHHPYLRNPLRSALSWDIPIDDVIQPTIVSYQVLCLLNHSSSWVNPPHFTIWYWRENDCGICYILYMQLSSLSVGKTECLYTFFVSFPVLFICCCSRILRLVFLMK
jgi:hypothetical protein